MRYKPFLIVTSIITTLSCSFAAGQDSFVAEAKRYVSLVSKPTPPWDGPTTGPSAQRGKSIIYVSADQRNGGARGVGQGVAEAAKVIGWNFRLIDGQGTLSGRRNALKQAASLNPDGIILGTIDALEQADAIRTIASKGIKMVGWHSLGKPGRDCNQPIFTNLATDPNDVGKAAAMYAVADSNGKAGVVIFNDPIYAIANAKTNAMIDTLRKCTGCSLLNGGIIPTNGDRGDNAAGQYGLGGHGGGTFRGGAGGAGSDTGNGVGGHAPGSGGGGGGATGGTLGAGGEGQHGLVLVYY